ncbi:head-tail adaptor protein [Pseudomonas fulva]|uniref:head-tail adaptor protein n=1 Tax=Pseudomonas TaxID=286 RepID=UPI000EC5D0FE|nr:MULTISPECIES: head-tail adaptor protein [Pseudomonas]MCY4123916.1 head-tail adaptor protein [Pseudomonas sp.]MBN6791501.1 head-tail adaptor protein [Pseudomonas fulva]MBN6795682.1 head-tail adaptor protein [Pseudomonas fulva]MBN6857244.1 head-tail adaptor protein [Pseudomonas fulva]MBN6874045.1 head-tail adaptor protein [Pseudomonas fulva]
MRAGALRHLFEVNFRHEERTKSGGAVVTWLPAARPKMWGEVRTPSGRIIAVAEKLKAVVTAEIISRPRADIVAGVRLTRRGVTYQVEAVLPDNENTLMRLLCSSVPNP